MCTIEFSLRSHSLYIPCAFRVRLRITPYIAVPYMPVRAHRSPPIPHSSMTILPDFKVSVPSEHANLLSGHIPVEAIKVPLNTVRGTHSYLLILTAE